jgi:hypothetical protein
LRYGEENRVGLNAQPLALLERERGEGTNKLVDSLPVHNNLPQSLQIRQCVLPQGFSRVKKTLVFLNNASVRIQAAVSMMVP